MKEVSKLDEEEKESCNGEGAVSNGRRGRYLTPLFSTAVFHLPLLPLPSFPSYFPLLQLF